MFAYNHHLGDYARDTQSLNCTEHGAYRMLLDHYYSTEAPIPADLKEACMICRAMTRIEQDAVKRVLGKFFQKTPDGYGHKRVEFELERMRLVSQTRSANGRKGGLAKGASAKQTPSEPLANAKQTPSNCQANRVTNDKQIVSKPLAIQLTSEPMSQFTALNPPSQEDDEPRQLRSDMGAVTGEIVGGRQ